MEGAHSGQSKRNKMADTTTASLIFLPLLLLLSISSTATSLPRSKLTTSDEELLQLSHTAASPKPLPTTYFQVTRPIPLPPKSKPCSTLVLQHDFAYTYGRPPVTAPYKPPSHCRHHDNRSPPSRIVLEWKAAAEGRQFDRIFGIWIGGVEILRSCTAEPRKDGIVWTVEKDVTRYSSLLARPQTLAVYLGNLVDSTYTGVYHVNVSFHFYYRGDRGGLGFRSAPPAPGFGSPADLVVPISRALPPNDGLWFRVENSSDVQTKEVMIPANTYRAMLEVYVSFHSNDESWYTNPPNVYIQANNLSGTPGNGPFREVTVLLDGSVVGAVWPFTVVYTGGVNPLLWRPITGIGSFDLPSYDIEITPFLGKLLDDKPHKFGFAVTNGLNVWFIDANLHLWLDKKSSHNVGSLIKYEAPAFAPSIVSNFKGLDGTFSTIASRQISCTGWVKSSHGKITTHFYQGFNYRNLMEFQGDGSIQVVNQTIDSNYGVYAKNPSSVLFSKQVFQNFPLYLYSQTTEQTNKTYTSVSNISFAFNEKNIAGERFGFSYDSVRNLQTGNAHMIVKGNLVISGIGATKQTYKYEGTDGCYFRNVSSSNYTILHDDLGDLCSKNPQGGLWYLFNNRIPYPMRRTSPPH